MRLLDGMQSAENLGITAGKQKWRVDSGRDDERKAPAITVFNDCAVTLALVWDVDSLEFVQPECVVHLLYIRPRSALRQWCN